MGAVLDARRRESDARLEKLRRRLSKAERIAGGNACVYAIGSFARGEAGKFSDLDLFIVGRVETNDGEAQRKLSNLDEILIKAELVTETRTLGLPEFSGDGAYLQHYTVADLTQAIGTTSDDYDNTLTARLLLLLESRPLFGRAVYDEAIAQTVAAYWRDFADHQAEFVPAFIANDILRLWRTFCVNYEARTRTEPEVKRLKRRLKNYKLKHSRLLTCYSALLYLMAVSKQRGSVRPEDAIAMVELTPTQRLEHLLSDSSLTTAHNTLRKLLECYEQFLSVSDAPEDLLLEQFRDADKRRVMFEEANAFGGLMFEALETLGERSRFHQMLLV